MYVYPFSLEPPSPPDSTPLGRRRVPTWAPAADSSFPLTTYFSYGDECMLVLLSELSPPSLSPAVSTSSISTSVSLFLPCKKVHRCHFLSHFQIICFYILFWTELTHQILNSYQSSNTMDTSLFWTIIDLSIRLSIYYGPHLEKEMAPNSSTLAWKIPWMEEPGGLQSRPDLVGRRESDTIERLYFHFLLSCVGEGNGNPLQCSCLGSPRNGEACWVAVHGVAQSQTRLRRLSSSSSSMDHIIIKNYLQIDVIILILSVEN